MILLDNISQLINETSEEVWMHTLSRLAAELGFDHVLVAVVPHPNIGIEHGFIQSTYPQLWRKTYDQSGMARFDPTVLHCRNSSLPLIWSPEIFRSAAQKSLYEDAQSVGLRSGVTLPMHGPNGQAGMLSVTTDRRRTAAVMRDIAYQLPHLSLLRDVALETCQPFFSKRLQSNIPELTPRELECLKWLVTGKSSWDIGKILKISEATVNFHIVNIRIKLKASSRRVAAVKAVQLGLIKPE